VANSDLSSISTSHEEQVVSSFW